MFSNCQQLTKSIPLLDATINGQGLAWTNGHWKDLQQAVPNCSKTARTLLPLNHHHGGKLLYVLCLTFRRIRPVLLLLGVGICHMWYTHFLQKKQIKNHPSLKCPRIVVISLLYSSLHQEEKFRCNLLHHHHLRDP